jgi:hypothetical protein
MVHGIAGRGAGDLAFSKEDHRMKRHLLS